MEKLVWDNKNSFNHTLIDGQHKMLYQLTNTLIENIDADAGSAVVVETLNELLLYYKIHFRDEEEFLAKVGYPAIVEHKKKHGDFIYKVAMFCKDASEKKSQITLDMIVFLKEWIINHISEEDQLYKDFL